MSHIFISYARKDHFFVNRLREDLQREQIDYWIDNEGLSPGTSSWELAIRKAIKGSTGVLWIVSPSSFESAYVRDEISIAQMYDKKIYPVFAEGEHWLEVVPIGTGQIQFIDARTNYENARETIIAELKAVIPTKVYAKKRTPTLPEGQEPRNPYKGLVAFSESDASDFFGREALVNKLETRLSEMISEDNNRFMAVVGPSGAGKSSVVMAGLIPALKTNQPSWMFLPKFVPGTNPIEQLAESLSNLFPDRTVDSLIHDLNTSGGAALHTLVATLPSEHVLLYIDQFEELFTLVEDTHIRQQFIDLITVAATEQSGKTVIVLSMRADFYGHPMKSPQLGPLFENNSVSVLPLTIRELQNAIEAPSRLPEVGLTFDRGLVAEIVFSLRDNDKARSGALPLLQFTLDRLYNERDGTHISFDAYTRLGGVQGAVGNHCEYVFSQLPDDVQSKLSHVFLPLISIDEDTGEATRRRASLDKGKSDKLTTAFIKAFVDNRLLQTGFDGKNPYVEIAHEALFRSWTRLSEWIDKTRKDLLLLREVQRDAQQWNRQGKPDHLLWSHERLRHVYEMQQNLGVKLNEYELEFITPEANRLLEEFIALVDGDARRGIWRQLNIVDRFAKIGVDAVAAMLVARQSRYSTSTTIPREITATIDSFEVSQLIPVIENILDGDEKDLKMLAVNYLRERKLLNQIDHPYVRALEQEREEQAKLKLEQAKKERAKQDQKNLKQEQESLEQEQREQAKKERAKREQEQRELNKIKTTAETYAANIKKLYEIKDSEDKNGVYESAVDDFISLWRKVAERDRDTQALIIQNIINIVKDVNYDPWIFTFLYTHSQNAQKHFILSILKKMRHENVMEQLLKMQHDTNWEIRWYATKFLGVYLPAQRAKQGIKDAKNDSHNQVRFIAKYTLKHGT